MTVRGDLVWGYDFLSCVGKASRSRVWQAQAGLVGVSTLEGCPTTVATSKAAFACEGCSSSFCQELQEQLEQGQGANPCSSWVFWGSVLSITTARELLYQRGGYGNVSIVLWCYHYPSAPSTRRAWALGHHSSTCSTDTTVCSPTFNLVTKSPAAPEA